MAFLSRAEELSRIRIVPSRADSHSGTSSTAIAIVGLYSFFNEGIEKIVKSVFCIPRNDELTPPFSKLTLMFILSESFLHFSGRMVLGLAGCPLLDGPC
jgi:hypothetical protein